MIYIHLTISIASFVQVFLIIAAVFAVIVYRLAIKVVFSVAVDFTSIQEVGVIGQFATPQMLTTITASCISLVVIMILNKVTLRPLFVDDLKWLRGILYCSCTSMWRFGSLIWVSY